MTKIVLQIDDLVRAVAAFDMAGDLLQDDTEVMTDIGDYGRSEVVETFMMQGRPPWEFLSEATIRKREARGNFSQLILRDTDQTLESFIGAGNEFTIFDAGNHKVVWGNSRPDFESHQEGSATEPQREILQILPEQEEHFAQMYLDWLIRPFEE